MSDSPIDVLLVEDEAIVRTGVGLWIEGQPQFRLVGSADSADTGEKLCLSLRPALVLLDIRFPDGDGVELGQRLRTQLPDLRVLLLSGSTDFHTVWRVRRSGVHGFVGKSDQPDVLRAAILTVAEGGVFFSAAFQRAEQHLNQAPDSFARLLSERQIQVLHLVARGLSDADIAARLHIATDTVEVHRKNLRMKIRVHDDRGLTHYAQRWGLASTR